MLINEIVEGKLTRKQQQALETTENVIRAFYDTENKKISRTWNDLLEITGLSKGALSKHLKELVRQDVVKGVVKTHKNRLTIFYVYTKKVFRIKGKTLPEEIPGNVCRIWFNDKGIKGWQWGYMKKSKGGHKYFVAEK